VNGQRLHYAECGSSDSGELLLFLHGFPECWYSWRHQLTAFAHTHHAVAVDMRGYNLSSKPTEVEAYTIPHLVEDVVTLIQLLGKRGATLVGHDWGGVVAWECAHAHPEWMQNLYCRRCDPQRRLGTGDACNTRYLRPDRHPRQQRRHCGRD
jgi:pimeloyl-ACP methyl ester carboxylesterase